jgi:hypothetical protein
MAHALLLPLISIFLRLRQVQQRDPPAEATRRNKRISDEQVALANDLIKKETDIRSPSFYAGFTSTLEFHRAGPPRWERSERLVADRV